MKERIRGCRAAPAPGLELKGLMALQLLARSPHPRTAETLNPGEATNTYTCYAAVSTALAIAPATPCYRALSGCVGPATCCGCHHLNHSTRCEGVSERSPLPSNSHFYAPAKQVVLVRPFFLQSHSLVLCFETRCHWQNILWLG